MPFLVSLSAAANIDASNLFKTQTIRPPTTLSFLVLLTLWQQWWLGLLSTRRRGGKGRVGERGRERFRSLVYRTGTETSMVFCGLLSLSWTLPGNRQNLGLFVCSSNLLSRNVAGSFLHSFKSCFNKRKRERVQKRESVCVCVRERERERERKRERVRER